MPKGRRNPDGEEVKELEVPKKIPRHISRRGSGHTEEGDNGVDRWYRNHGYGERFNRLDELDNDPQD